MEVKKQQLELDMEQQTGSKLGKECIKASLYRIISFIRYCINTFSLDIIVIVYDPQRPIRQVDQSLFLSLITF